MSVSADKSGLENDTAAEDGSSRRSFLGRLASWAMVGSLVAAYGSLAAVVARFFYPARAERKHWLYVRDLPSLPTGQTLKFRLPDGRPVNVTHHGAGATTADFRALSSTCPHLGCQVHWEPQNERFFCPCHNGVFSPDGQAVSGPPADAGQSLPSYALKVEGGLLYIEVPETQLAAAQEVAVPTRPGCEGCPKHLRATRRS